jgi:hypothetical protein
MPLRRFAGTVGPPGGTDACTVCADSADGLRGNGLSEVALGATSGVRPQGIAGDIRHRLTFGHPMRGPAPCPVAAPDPAAACWYFAVFEWDKATLIDRGAEIFGVLPTARPRCNCLTQRPERTTALH